MELIKVNKILPDEEQPRKYFDPIKMKSLKDSIKKHGIIRALDVEDLGNGKYLLEDGERRFRAAVELGLDVVPCNITGLLSASDRLVRQFTIQEQQEAWSPMEKAMSLLNLSKALGIELIKVCELLDIPRRDATRYVAFATISDKENFVKNEVPLVYAMPYKSLKGLAKSISRNVLNKEFTKDDEKTLEHQLTKGIIKGTIIRTADLTHLGDAFKKNPKLIDKFMTRDSVTPDSLYLEAKARGAYSLRNAVNDARQMTTHIKAFLEEQDVVLTDEQVAIFKHAQKAAGSIVNLAE